MRETSRRLLWGLAAAVVVVNLYAVWGPWIRGTGSGDLEIDVLYRYGRGDIQYLPFVRALADWTLGDPAVLENQCRGVLSFPFLTLVPYGALLPLLGAATWLIVDAAVFALTFLALRAFLRAFRLQPALASLAAAGVLLAHPEWLLGGLGFRIPRPFLTTPLSLWALAGAVHLCTDFQGAEPARLRRLGVWVGAGCALVLQSDLYSAVSLHMLVAVVAAGHFLAALRHRETRGRVIAFLTGCAPAYALCLVPFLVQRALEPADLPRRMGVFPVRGDTLAFGLDAGTLALAAGGAVALALLARYGRRLLRGDTQWVWAASAACALIACAELSYQALALGTGRMIQPYHFQFQPAARFALLGGVAAVTGAAVRRLTARSAGDAASPGRRRALALGALLVVLPATALRADRYRRTGHPMTRTGHLRADFRTYADLGRGYRADLAEVIGYLRGEAGEAPLVLATLDYQLYCWWVGFTDGYAFNPDPFSTTLTDHEIEERLLDLGKLVGLSTAEFREQLTATDKTHLTEFNNDSPLTNFFWSHNKYQSSWHHRAAPAADYDPASVAASARVRSSWHMVIPRPVVDDMLARYASHELPTDRRPPDVVVMLRRGALAAWDREPGGYRRTLQNDVFSVYRR